MALSWESKDPDEVADYEVDWTARLAGDTISASAFSIVSGTVAIVGAANTHTDAASTCFLSGGADGETAVLQCRIATAGGRIFEETVALPIRSSADATLVVSGYVAPTPANLVDLYPAFAAVPVRTIQLWLTFAGNSVDDTWTEADYPFAILALAAFEMESRGLGTGAAAQAAAAGASGFRVMRSGALTLERFDTSKTASGGSASRYASSMYGQTWLDLLRRNRGGPRVTGAPNPAVGVSGAAVDTW